MKIKIKKCTALGKEFEGLKPNSTHDTVDVPKAEKHKELIGVWVMGFSEPVRLLPGEYIEQ